MGKFIAEHLDDVLKIFGAVVAIITIVVKFTETDKDDTWWAKVLKVLAALSLVNPDGSVIGKKPEEEKEDVKALPSVVDILETPKENNEEAK